MSINYYLNNEGGRNAKAQAERNLRILGLSFYNKINLRIFDNVSEKARRQG